MSFWSSFLALGVVLGSIFDLWELEVGPKCPLGRPNEHPGGRFGDQWASGLVLVDSWEATWGSQGGQGTSQGRFWEDFGADLEPFWSPKVRKSGPKSIPETNRFLDLDVS